MRFVTRCRLGRAAGGPPAGLPAMAQGGDPVEAVRLEVLLDAGPGDHAAVAHQGDALKAEAQAQVGDLLDEGVRVGGVALEGAHGDGAAVAVARQAADDFGAVGAAVAGVTAGGESVAGALDLAKCTPLGIWPGRTTNLSSETSAPDVCD